jgi:cleavage stimulation factor subunit 2
VDFSNDTVGDEDNRDRDRDRGARADIPQGNYAQPSNGTSNLPGGQPTMVVSSSSSLPPLPQGKDLPPGVSCTDAISKTLNTLPPAQLLDILQQVQQFAVHDPARLTELFTQAPQLTYAVFQGLLLMGLVTPDAINSVLDNPTQPPQAPAAAPMPGGAPPPYSYPGATGTPPVAMGAGYGPPPVVPSPAPAPAAAPAGQDPEALMRAVMELPQETIDQLPEAERQQIMALRASFGMQRR